MTHKSPNYHSGFTLVELLMAIAIGSLLVTGVSQVVSRTLQARNIIQDQNELTRQTRFAMQQMMQSVGQTRLLQIPLKDDPATSLIENIREQTIPASSPPTGSTFASAVLAVTLPLERDLDGNGIADADNDGDGRIDEDLPDDSNNDGIPGISGIDDDGNGVVDLDSILISADNNNDGCPGICAVDDDGDGNVDNAAIADDDEDGSSDEDWYDSVVYYLSGNNLIQRTPVPWDANGSGTVTGQDYIEEVIAGNVSRFRVERVIANNASIETIAISLQLTSPLTDTTVSLSSLVRVGGGL